jgi:hypothetical protein
MNRSDLVMLSFVVLPSWQFRPFNFFIDLFIRFYTYNILLILNKIKCLHTDMRCNFPKVPFVVCKDTIFKQLFLFMKKIAHLYHLFYLKIKHATEYSSHQTPLYLNPRYLTSLISVHTYYLTVFENRTP